MLPLLLLLLLLLMLISNNRRQVAAGEVSTADEDADVGADTD